MTVFTFDDEIERAYPQPVSDDNAGNPVLSLFNFNNGEVVPYYLPRYDEYLFETGSTYELKYTATDAAGHQAMCEFTIDVKSKLNAIMKYYADTTWLEETWRTTLPEVLISSLSVQDQSP